MDIEITQLKNYIPIASPPRRIPVDGTESDLRPSLSFDPAWYTRRFDIDFGKKWHLDPVYRYTTLKKMKVELSRRFPSVPYWNTEGCGECATISGVFGAFPIPHFFGLPLIFRSDGYPTLDPNRKVSVSEIEKLSPKEVLNGPEAENLFQQMDIIEKEWGKINGILNWQGVINNAFNLRGPDIFMDMIEKPDFVHSFFNLITDVMIRLIKKIQARQAASKVYYSHISLSNCVLNMVSPQMYEEQLFEFDKRFAESFPSFGVHTCEWDITPYAEIFTKLPKLGYLDMGMTTDLKKIKKMFPHTRRAVMYSADNLNKKTHEDIRKDMERIYNEIAPCDVVIADIQADTPDERVTHLIEMCAEIEKK